jgi:hypothetical protein
MAKLGLTAHDVEFWLLHDELDKVHGSGAFDLVCRHLPGFKGVDEHDILTAIEDSMFAWKIFLDGIADAAEGRV